ncbi:hypothetical protein GGX14DRAFT_408473 [Mycena pura]|uniref:Uncharacterized protein n=1 Tax=Mycena pura TaxID=153505 RepID=A0AAD6ULQ8_9AGAR|nr:hypothetical protein GGX14DRAFT_408473 [Mycena pura]
MSQQDASFQNRLGAVPLSIDEVAAGYPGYEFQYNAGQGEDRDIELVDGPMSFNRGVHPGPGLFSPPRGTLHLPPDMQPTACESPRIPLGDATNPFPSVSELLASARPPIPAPWAPSDTNIPAAPSATLFAELPKDPSHVAKLVTNKPKGKENGKEKKGKGKEKKVDGKMVFSGVDLIAVCRIVIDVNPFLASHGQKGAAWQEVADKLLADGFRHTVINRVAKPTTYTWGGALGIHGFPCLFRFRVYDCKGITGQTIHQKAEALVGWKKNPTGKHKHLGGIIGEGTSTSISIGALLERLETNYDEAKDKSDEAKAKLKKKNDEDREGAEAIRRASMGTLRKRAHRPEKDAEDDTDIEPAADKTTASSSTSLESLDADNTDRKSKRRRIMEPRPSSDDALIALISAENTRRAEYDARMINTLEALVTNTNEQKSELASILREALLK